LQQNSECLYTPNPIMTGDHWCDFIIDRVVPGGHQGPVPPLNPRSSSHINIRTRLSILGKFCWDGYSIWAVFGKRGTKVTSTEITYKGGKRVRKRAVSSNDTECCIRNRWSLEIWWVVAKSRWVEEGEEARSKDTTRSGDSKRRLLDRLKKRSRYNRCNTVGIWVWI